MNLQKLKSLLISIIIMYVISSIFQLAGRYLVIEEVPHKSDVIVVLSGGGMDRLEKGVKLFQQGFAPYLLISNGSEDGLLETALNMGVPLGSIIIENKAKSTTENALFSIELMLKHKFQSAIIVSSNYHMRRVKYNYDKANNDLGLNFIYSPSIDTGYDPNTWWLKYINIKITIIEYSKLVGNVLGIHGEKAKEFLNFF